MTVSRSKTITAKRLKEATVTISKGDGVVRNAVYATLNVGTDDAMTTVSETLALQVWDEATEKLVDNPEALTTGGGPLTSGDIANAKQIHKKMYEWGVAKQGFTGTPE
jgi:hypothetical protein